MTTRIIYTSEMSNYNYIYKFEDVGDEVSGRYVGIIHMRGKFPHDYILLSQNSGVILVKLYSQFEDITDIFRRDDLVRIKLDDIIRNENNPEQKFYKFKIEISVQGEEDAKNEKTPF